MATIDQVTDYAQRIQGEDPQVALQIVVAESQRQQALAAKANEEYRAMAELQFDAAGRIASANMAGLYRLATIYSQSRIVPEHYQGKPADCFIACQMAFRLKVDPMAYMQSSYIVHGRPGIEAKLAIALLNTSGAIKGRIRYEMTGEKEQKQCTAYATDAETGEEVSACVDWRMVKAEGWIDKKGSKWLTMPDVMFRYRAATFLVRQFYPEVMMGIQTVDELEDIGPGSPTTADQGPRRMTLDSLADRLIGHAEQPVEDQQPEDPSEPAEESGLEPGETVDDAGEVHPAAADPIAQHAWKFDECQTLGDVTMTETELIGLGLTAEQQDAVAKLAEAARERVRAKRGQRSNG